MIKALIFDLDGTLIDTLKDIKEAMNDTLIHFGFSPQPIEVYQDLIGGGSRNMVKNLLSSFSSEPFSPSPLSISASALLAKPPAKNMPPLNLNLSMPSLNEVYDFYLNHYGTNLINHTVAYEGVKNALHTWQAQGIKLAVVTNKHHQQAKILLEALFTAPESTDNKFFAKSVEFCVMQGLGDAFPKKPAPNSTLHVLECLNIKADEALFIGDTITDQQTATNAGVEFVFVNWGYGCALDLGQSAKEDIKVISHINELQKWIVATTSIDCLAIDGSQVKCVPIGSY
ncbi:HAD family hydrolase [Shewanella surugensis]|uniref:phosphoglycolate phosphatase n=1 Tax=Shewanella surugensis TaxID=212020 RepID=A0ABT0LFL1_9GAMM|nr:HAD hydrolase-like protein [Shewanella surugensis]MCL1126497.1 HAD hydrolase-like protein [Shewanella surugensis]